MKIGDVVKQGRYGTRGTLEHELCESTLRNTHVQYLTNTISTRDSLGMYVMEESLLVKKRTLLSPSPYSLLFSNHRVHVTQEQMNTKIFRLILAKN